MAIKITPAALLAAGVSPAIAAKYNKGLNASEASAVKQVTGMDVISQNGTGPLSANLVSSTKPYIQKDGMTIPKQERYTAQGFSPVSSMTRKNIQDQVSSLESIYQKSVRDPISYLASIAKKNNQIT